MSYESVPKSARLVASFFLGRETDNALQGKLMYLVFSKSQGVALELYPNVLLGKFGLQATQHKAFGLFLKRQVAHLKQHWKKDVCSYDHACCAPSILNTKIVNGRWCTVEIMQIV